MTTPAQVPQPPLTAPEPVRPLHDSRGKQTRHRADPPTLGIDAQHPFGIDAYTLLDHRTRVRCVTRDLAAPGRYLEIEHEQGAYLIPLDRAITHIGRGLAADLRLEDPHVSRRHAIIAQRGDGARVLDDRSSSGVFVNGRSVSIGYLTDGDVLRLGRVVFRFVEVPPPTAQPRRRIALPIRARPAAAGAA